MENAAVWASPQFPTQESAGRWRICGSNQVSGDADSSAAGPEAALGEPQLMGRPWSGGAQGAPGQCWEAREDTQSALGSFLESNPRGEKSWVSSFL